MKPSVKSATAVIVLLLTIVLPLTFVSAQETDYPVPADHRELLDRIAVEGLAAANYDLVAAWVADDYINMTPLGSLDRAGLIGFFQAMHASLSDFAMDREFVIVEDDMGATRLVIRGVFDGEPFATPMGLLEPNGATIAIPIHTIHRFDDAGRMIEEWVTFDVLDFLTQLGAFPAPAGASGVMSVEEADAFVARFDQVFNIPDLDVLDEIFSQDYVGHLPLAPVIDLQGLKDYIDTFRAGVPDMIQTTHQVIIGEHELVVRVTYTGTHTGTLFGVPATGNPIVMEGIGILRFDDSGLVVENWAVLDMIGVLAQIGAFPPA